MRMGLIPRVFRADRFSPGCCKDRKGFRRYGGVFFHVVPTKRGSAGAYSRSTSLLGKPRNPTLRARVYRGSCPKPRNKLFANVAAFLFWRRGFI